MRELIKRAVEITVRNKQIKKEEPCGILYEDLMHIIVKQMRKELNALQKDGVIKARKTLNSVMIFLNDETNGNK